LIVSDYPPIISKVEELEISNLSIKKTSNFVSMIIEQYFGLCLLDILLTAYRRCVLSMNLKKDFSIIYAD
jgi:hypothetical protein